MKIVLVDDHAVVREGYRALIARQHDMQVMGEYQEAGTAYNALKEQPFDIIITDLNMPGLSALEMIERLKYRGHQGRCVVFTMYSNSSFAKKSFAAGARGYVTKSSDPSALLHGLREVYAGRRYLSADIAQAAALDRFDSTTGALDELTVREFEILRLLVDGRSVEDVAESLSLSPKTIRNVHYTVKKKLDVRDDIELVRRAIQLKVLDTLEF